jgi:hypothetical protein
MKILFAFCFFLTIFSPVFAQNQTDSIEFDTKVGTVIMQNNSVISPMQLLYVMQSNTEAFEEISIALNCRSTGIGLAVVGGFAIGWTIGKLVIGRETNWKLAGVGAGCIVASISLQAVYLHHARKAVLLYNAGLKQTGYKIPELKMGITANGLGVSLLF